MNIIITGATSGIGKSVAEYLVNQNHQVIGCGRSADDELNPEGLSWLKMDVTDQESVSQAIQKAAQHFEQIDVLIQCAGQGAIGPMETFTSEEIEAVFQLNVLGIQRVNKAVLPVMRKQGKGRIIMISSMASETGLPYNGVYCASKAALDVMTESMRFEIKQFGIEACVLQPGDFKTEVAVKRKQPKEVAGSPYQQQFDEINAKTIANVEHAGDPIRVAKKISTILKKKRLKPKYRVGAFLELIMPTVKVILPSSCFEKLIRSYYNM